MLKVRVGIPHARAAKCQFPFVFKGGRPLHSTQESQLAVEKRRLSIKVPAAARRGVLDFTFQFRVSSVSFMFHLYCERNASRHRRRWNRNYILF